MSSESLDALGIAAVMFIVLAVIQQVFSVGAMYIGENVAWVATNQLRVDLVMHCLKLDMSYHNNTSPGELIERLDSDVVELSNFFSQLVIRVSKSAALVESWSSVGEDWRMGIVFTVLQAQQSISSIGFVVSLFRRKAIRDIQAELFLEEQLAGQDIRSRNGGFVINRLYQLHKVLLKRWLDRSIKGLWVRFTAGIC
jgi:ATP-binding cassette subfamily B protein/ATP-binding cassette subfamily C protein